MSRSSAKKKRRGPPPTRPIPDQHTAAEEQRGAEALTVFWMLTFMATLTAEGVAGGSALLSRWWGNEVGGPALLAILPGVMLFTALATGSLCLALTLVVRRVRREPPPANIVRAAVAVGLSPWAILLIWRAL